MCAGGIIITWPTATVWGISCTSIGNVLNVIAAQVYSFPRVILDIGYLEREMQQTLIEI